MTFSAFFGKKTRILLVCLLALVMLSMLCLTVGAVKNEQTLLTLDPNDMASVDGSNENFEWKSLNTQRNTIKNVTTDTYSGNVLSCQPAIYWIYDTNRILPTYEVVVVSTDLYFETFPSGTREENGQNTTCDPNSDLPFMSQSVLCWPGNYDGLRIDSEGNLYSSLDLSSALGFRMEKQTWYNLKLIYSKISNRTEIWVDGERIATTSIAFRNQTAEGIRFFDGRFSYTAYVKNVNISASNTPYYTGIVKEASSDFVSYQTTKPDGGSFKLRIIAGINDLSVPTFGYKVVKLTKDANGNTVSELLTGTDDKAYSAIYGGETPYRIKDLFGYNYACLATVPDLQENSKYTELVIFPYTVSFAGDKVYGTPISLVYTGKTDDDGYPLLDTVNTTQTNLAPTDDTFISRLSAHVDPQGTKTPLQVRNTYDEANDTMYRAAYFKFTIPKETVDRLDSMAHVFLNVSVYYEDKQYDPPRVKEPLAIFASTTDWEEDTLTYNKHVSENIAVRGETIDTIDGEDCSGYIKFDVLDYVQKQAKTATNADGSLTVSFCVTQKDKTSATAPVLLYVYSKEHGVVDGKSVAPYLSLVESLYGHDITNVKSENVGYEPLSYAEKLVDTWFDEIYPEIYLDENGDPLYHSAADAFNPTGYATTAEGGEGDFRDELVWKAGTPWHSKVTTNTLSGGFVEPKEKWDEPRFARTLSTLGTSTANAYKQTTTTDYDAYGGITNLPTSEGTMLKGTATRYFHTEKIDGRTYIIDPLGNPYFAVSVNTVVYGDTQNQRDYVDEAYGSSDAFFTQISASLRDIGVNTAFVSSSADLLEIKENGLAVTVSVNGIGGYMGKLGRSQVSEGLFPNNNTINVFDPDFVTYVNQQNEALIDEKGYAQMNNLFGYTSDNELPSGVTILERYLTIDPSIPENIFSYQTAWAWLARKMNTPNPSLSLLRDLSAEDYAAYNSEFLGFVYAMYYKTVSESVKAADPNHMYIGSRVNGNCPYDEGYLRAAGKYLDLITINLYDGLNPKSTTLNAIYRYSGKPFVVTEFFAKGLDAIDANGYKLATSTGAGILTFTQEDRATYYEHYVLNLLETNACVGWVWYRFRDNDQSHYTVTLANGTVHENVILLSSSYGEYPYPNSLMTEDGTLHWLSEFYSGDPEDWASATNPDGSKIFTQTYSGEKLASNQNINKGFYNSDFSSVVTVYTYNTDGTLRTFLQEGEDSKMTKAELLTFGSVSYEVKDPESAYLTDETVLTSKDGTQTFTLGRQDNDDGTYTITKLTVYKGRYIELTDKVKEVSDNLVDLIQYFK